MAPVLSVILLQTPPTPVASTVSPLGAPATALRKLPGPASLQLVTNTVANTDVEVRPRIAVTHAHSIFGRLLDPDIVSILARSHSLSVRWLTLSSSLQ